MASPYVVPVGASVARPVLGELGVSGTANYSGQLHVESAPDLSHRGAFGQPGATAWGWWESIGKTDPRVAAALEFVVSPIRDATLTVEPASDDVRAVAQADFVRWALAERLEPGLSLVLEQATRGLLPGFALHEHVWGEVSHAALPGGRGWSVVRMPQRLPASVDSAGWLEDDAGRLRAVRQSGPKPGGGWTTVDLPAEKVTLWTWRQEGGNWQGVSAFRPVWYLAKIRRELIRMLGVAESREAVGIPVATADKDATPLTDAQADDLRETLRNLVFHESAYFLLPPGWKLDWVFSGGTANRSHLLESYNALGNEILAALSAQQMVLGVNGEGNRAVGEVHYTAADAFVAGVASWLEQCLNGTASALHTGLVRKLVDANWQGVTAYPRVRLTLKRAGLAPQAKATARAQAKAAGLLTWTPADEASLRDDLGLGAIEEPAEIEPTPPPAEPPPAEQSLRHAFEPRRALRPSEMVLDLARMDSFLATAKADFERGARPLVAAMLAKALPAVEAAMADGDPSDMGERVRLDSAALAVFVAEFLSDAAAEGAAEVRAELGAPQAHAKKTPPPSKVREASAKQTVKRMVGRLVAQLEDAAIETMRTGGKAADVVASVTERVLTDRSLVADSEGVLARVWNGGREDAARELGGVALVELSSALDAKTCTACEALDGARFEFDSVEHALHVPPLKQCDGGARCRCVLVYLRGEK